MPIQLQAMIDMMTPARSCRRCGGPMRTRYSIQEVGGDTLWAGCEQCWSQLLGRAVSGGPLPETEARAGEAREQELLCLLAQAHVALTEPVGYQQIALLTSEIERVVRGEEICDAS